MWKSQLLATFVLFHASCTPSPPSAPGRWMNLTATATAREAWAGLNEKWIITDRVTIDPASPRELRAAASPGAILVTAQDGPASNLVTKQHFTDLDVHVEFLIPRGSNSGVKLMGLYEIQIFDSFGRTELTGSD